jgi:hypothetical protein
MLPDLVVGTDFIATVPLRLARQKARTLPIKILQPPVDFPPIVEFIQWQRYQDEDAGLIWLRHLIKSCVQDKAALPHNLARLPKLLEASA